MTRRALDAVAASLDPDRFMHARWFAGKHRSIVGFELVDAMQVPGSRDGYLLLVAVSYTDAGAERYLIPAWRRGDHLVEPGSDDGFFDAVVTAIRDGVPLNGASGVFLPRPAPALMRLSQALGGERPLGIDQSNSSYVLGETLLAKCYRRLEAGEHPEIEACRALSENQRFRHVPAFAGSLHYRDATGAETALMLLQQYISDAEPAWDGIIERLASAAADADYERLTDEAAEAGRIAADLHLALGAAFGWSTATTADGEAWLADALDQLEQALRVVDGEAGRELAAAAPRIRQAVSVLADAGPVPIARLHGDLHYAQFLRSRSGVYVIDFEGEPTRPLAHRRRPGSPLQDVASLIRSLDHIGSAAQRRLRRGAGLDAERWITRACQRAAAAYAGGVAGSEVMFDADLLHAFEVAKETYEFVYAGRVLPSWLYAPQLGMRRLLAD